MLTCPQDARRSLVQETDAETVVSPKGLRQWELPLEHQV
jgi:hypothetical protein